MAFAGLRRLALAALLPAFVLATHGSAAAQGELLPASATAWNIGLRVVERGEHPDSPPYTARYRRIGDREWTDALPLDAMAVLWSRTLFAGSILGLEPGTRYEIELRSPGGEVYSTEVETRRLPALHPGRAIAVSPAAGPTGGLTAALAGAQPGDVLTLAPGEYVGPFEDWPSGTPEAPITLIGSRDGEVILRTPPGEIGPVVIAGDSHDVHLRDLTIVGAGPSATIDGELSTNWVVSGCLVLGGIEAGSSHWWIEDNMIVGRYPDWNARRETVPGGTGVNAKGHDHVIAFNQISYFYDGINTALIFRRNLDFAFQAEGPSRAIDIVGNLVFAAHDDPIQVDHVGVNIRVHANRMFWGFVGISFQDLFPGPVYATRNVITDVAWEPWKLMGSTEGVRIMHNSSESSLRGMTTSPADLRNSQVMNNLLLGRQGPSLGSQDPRTRWNHNAYSLPVPAAIRWSADGGASFEEFGDLATWSRGTGNEADGLSIRAAVELAGSFTGASDAPRSPADLVPREGTSLVAAGTYVPGISIDRNTPTIGAYRAGSDPPAYGPRRIVPGAAQRGFYLDVDALELTRDAVGYSPLSMRETIVRFIDTNNISLTMLASAAFALGIIAGVVIGWHLRSSRGRRETG